MTVGVQDPQPPDPYGHKYSPHMMGTAKCYLCSNIFPIERLAAYPFGYVRMSYDILPTWMPDGTVKGRIPLPLAILRSGRGTPLSVPFVCNGCWDLCQQTDQTIQELGIELGAWEDKPPF